ncbi:hypothetical protein BV20DRAFT_979571 [Pilatotrama ljubarskyi]|nr:hypothetical protein BV20DRAFT_979571 [Pilatotrama ljubarskyi]
MFALLRAISARVRERQHDGFLRERVEDGAFCECIAVVKVARSHSQIIVGLVLRRMAARVTRAHIQSNLAPRGKVWVNAGVVEANGQRRWEWVDVTLEDQCGPAYFGSGSRLVFVRMRDGRAAGAERDIVGVGSKVKVGDKEDPEDGCNSLGKVQRLFSFRRRVQRRRKVGELRLFDCLGKAQYR